MAPWTVLYQIGLKSRSHRPSYPGRAPIPEPPEPQSVPPPRPCRLAQKSCSGCSFRAPSLCWHTNDPRWIETNSRNAPAAPTMESVPCRTLSSHMGVRVCVCVCAVLWGQAGMKDLRWISADGDRTGEKSRDREGTLLRADSAASQ